MSFEFWNFQIIKFFVYKKFKNLKNSKKIILIKI